MTVLCAYSRAAAMAPNRPAIIKALAAKAISDCWSAAVEMKVLEPSMSVPTATATPLSDGEHDEHGDEGEGHAGGGELADLATNEVDRGHD